MPSFGTGSKKKLSTCDKLIRVVCIEAIKHVDFTILTGHRNKETQNALYPKYTQLKWPKGKHNKFPSMAIDIAPYINPYGIISGSPNQIAKIADLRNVSKAQANAFVIKSYARLIGHIEAIAAMKGIPIKVGMDWDGDYDMLDQTFNDLGHWELR
jgi:hypothetical protein